MRFADYKRDEGFILIIRVNVKQSGAAWEILAVLLNEDIFIIYSRLTQGFVLPAFIESTFQWVKRWHTLDSRAWDGNSLYSMFIRRIERLIL